MKKEYPVCPFHATKCFAYSIRSMRCKALENTSFDLWKGCPFYKTKEQHKAECEKAKTDIEELEDEEYE